MIAELSQFFTNGCGPYWIANSITSIVMGEKNRGMQPKIAEENEAFQLRMEKLRNLSQEEMEWERIKFRRHLMDLTREWRREEKAQAAINMDEQIQLPIFAEQWPLALLPTTIISQLKQRNPQQLNVILLHTPLIAGTKGQIVRRENHILQQEKIEYQKLEYAINKNMPQIGNVYFRQDAHQKENSTHADLMNIHFLMGSIPTLVLIPKYQDERLSLSIAMWDEQAARPYIRPLFAMPHDPIMARDNQNYLDEVIDKLHYSASIITGTIRDQYAMLTWGKEPTLKALLDAKGNEKMKQFALQNKAIKDFVLQENMSTMQALETKKIPELLDVYDEADIDNMRALLSKQKSLYNAK